MYQPATCFNSESHRIAFFVAVLGVVSALCAASRAADSSPRPAIRQVEIGIKNHFKVGAWTPIRVETEGIEGLERPRVEVSVADSDVVPTSAASPLTATASTTAQCEGLIYTAVGRVGDPIRISLFDGEKQLDEKTLRPAAKAKPDSRTVVLPATAELIVSLGQPTLGLKDAFPDRESDAGQLARQAIKVNRIADLPSDWFGYEAVDVLLISAGDGKLCRELAADEPRLEALSQWVELGGRLVVMCGGQAAQDLFAAGKPLAKFAPGKLAEVVPLRSEETGPLEHFAGSAPTIAGGSVAPIRVPRFTDVKGNIEVYAGRRASDLPLVVRSPYGLGEVAIAGIDLSQPPFRDWPGRAAFLQCIVASLPAQHQLHRRVATSRHTRLQ